MFIFPTVNYEHNWGVNYRQIELMVLLGEQNFFMKVQNFIEKFEHF